MRRTSAAVLSILVAVAPARAGDGNFDLGFGSLGVVATNIAVPNISDVAIQPDGAILATGRGPATSPLVARFDSTGAFDPSFGTGGIATVPATGNAYGVTLQADGKILLAGTDFVRALLVRLDASGTPDASFGTGGIVTEAFSAASSVYADVAFDPAGKIVAVGSSGGGARLAMARHLLADGSLDPSFWVGGRREISLAANTLGGAVVRQPDGKLLVGGSMAPAGPALLLSGFLMRFDDAGSADGAFGTNGLVTYDFGPRSDTLNDLALQPDGRIVVSGDSNRAILIARFTSTGALDTTFNGTGYRHVAVGAVDSGRRMILQPDGKIVVVGYSFAVAGQPSTGSWVVVRLLPDGTLDPSFGNGGIVRIRLDPTNGGIAYNGARQADGKLVIAGLNGSASVGPLALVRLGGDCGDGAVAGLELCDDGNAVAGDCCDLGCQPEPADQPCPSSSVCLAHRCDGAGRCGVPEAATGCTLSQGPGQPTLALKDAPPGSSDTLDWKYRKGGATTLDALGEPFVTTDYALCGYGPDLGNGPTLLFELDAPAGGLCGQRVCWSSLGARGYTYRDKERTPTGLDVLRVRSGDAGRVSMRAKGKGPNLTLPALPMSLPARVQLRTSDGGCWETTFSAAGALRNDGTQFRGKAD